MPHLALSRPAMVILLHTGGSLLQPVVGTNISVRCYGYTATRRALQINIAICRGILLVCLLALFISA